MNNLDTLTLLIPDVKPQSVQLKNYHTVDEGKTLYRANQLHLTYGLNEISYHGKRQELKVNLSSKLLGQDYFRMINQDTLPAIYSKLLEPELFTFEFDELYNSKVLRCDITCDLPVTDVPVPAALTALEAYGSRLYSIDQVRRNKSNQKTSVVFRKNRVDPDYQVRLTAYWKSFELLKAKNKDFLSSLSPLHICQLTDQAENIIRLETRFTTFAQIRNHLAITDNTLCNVMASPKKVIHSIMQEITTAAPIGKASQRGLDPLALSLKEYNLYSVIQSFDFDMPSLRAFVKSKEAKNYARTIKPYEEVYAKLQHHTPGPVTQMLDYLNQN